MSDTLGFLPFLGSAIWDGRLTQPIHALRKLLLLHPFAVVLPLVAAPLLALRKRPLVLFVACIPMAFTLMTAPYHGLPRYAFPAVPFAFVIRSEEHTSELQSLMRISYAVSCLKKKKK